MTTKYNLDAYYYGFDPTGVDAIDRVLACVASAGKAFHHTREWDEEIGPLRPCDVGDAPIDWIQNAANDAAALILKLEG